MRPLLILASGFLIGCSGPSQSEPKLSKADRFELVRTGMSPSDIRAVFPEALKTSETSLKEGTLMEYRYQRGSEWMGNPPRRQPVYVWFYFLDGSLVEWRDERIGSLEAPDQIIEWRTR